MLFYNNYYLFPFITLNKCNKILCVMKKNILFIFDCFGVLVNEIAPIWFNKYFKKEKANELKHYYFKKADIGDLTILETLKQISLDLNFDYLDLVNEWCSLISINKELLDYLNDIKDNFYLAILSNAPRGLFEIVFKNYDINSIFDKVFISGENKMVKPDYKFYSLCIDSFNVSFDDIYMIDDNENNFSQIKDKGIKTILYKNNSQIKHLFDKNF